MEKEVLFFQYTRYNSFVKRDVEILQEKFSIALNGFNPSSKALLPAYLLWQLLSLPFLLIGKKGVLIYFGGYHSLLPCFFAKLYGIKSVIVVGGTDAVSFPEINYGNFRKPLLAWFTAKSYQLASTICPVHQTLAYTHYTYFGESEQGVLAFVPTVKHKIQVINNGYRPWLWPQLQVERKPRSFLTVSLTLGFAYYQRKGIDLIVEAAKKFPDCTFTIVGADNPALTADAPKNIIWLQPMPFEQLKEVYNLHAYYLQLSICEGLPNSLCEAMLCGCVPIGSAAMSIPEIIGDSGFVVEKREIEQVCAAIDKALNAPIGILGEIARKRIENDYPYEHRKNEFLKLFS
ncbi:MAG: glycosyltransferase family 4 protein [Luteibaculaceae bacterium]